MEREDVKLGARGLWVALKCDCWDLSNILTLYACWDLQLLLVVSEITVLVQKISHFLHTRDLLCCKH